MDDAQKYLSEWNQAQERYRAGVNGGYTDRDAEDMYLAPVRAKWDILKSVPTSMRDKASTELDDAHLAFLKGIQSGYKTEDAAKLYLTPELEKWAGASAFKHDEGDPLIEHKIGALQEVQDGAPVQSVILNHPQQIFGDSKFQTRFMDTAHRAETERLKEVKSAATAAEKEAAKMENDFSPEALAKKFFSLKGKSDKLPDDSPLKSYFNDRVGELENSLTNAPTATMPEMFAARPFTIQPPAEQEIAAQHPGWTPDQVKLGASGRISGAITVPEVGEVRKGYKYLGGQPADRNNWQKVK